MLTSKQRAFLRGQGALIDPIFQIGKDGISDNSVTAIANALKARELVKIHLLDSCPYSPRQAREELCDRIGCESVQVIGSKIVLFLQKKKESRYDLKNLELNY